MSKQQNFDDCLAFLCESLGHGKGHTHRHKAFQDYCRGLMLPLERKSVEPLAASLAPDAVSARHRALHHFAAQSDWDDQTILDRVAEWVVPTMTKADPELFWIIDDTGFPKLSPSPPRPRLRSVRSSAPTPASYLGARSSLMQAMAITPSCAQALPHSG